METEYLPTEVLMKIFIYSTKNPRQLVRKKQSRYANVRPAKWEVTLLLINKTFLYILAPILLPVNFHAIVGLTSTRYIKSFKSFDDYMRKNYYEYYGDGKESATKQMEEKKVPEHYSLTFVDLMELHTAYELAQLNDYVLCSVYSKDFQHYEYKYADDYLFFSGHDKKFFKFCDRVMNNEQSIMKQFVKSFTVDLLFFDEFQTSRVSQNTLLGDALQKYYPNANEYLSMKTKPFKCLTNVVPSRIYWANNQEHEDEEEGGKEANNGVDSVKIAGQAQLFKDDYNHKYPSDIYDWIKAWDQIKQQALYACFNKFYRSGKRSSLVNETLKDKVRDQLNEVFKEFNEIDHHRVKRSLTAVDGDSISNMTEGQRVCCRVTQKVIETTRAPSRGFGCFDLIKGEFITKDDVSRLVDQLLNITKSSKNIDTSFLAFSLKNCASRKKCEGFELMRPKMIVINKPAEKEESKD